MKRRFVASMAFLVLLAPAAWGQDTVDLTPAPECITPVTPTNEISVDFNRADVTGVRGYSVTFVLSAELALSGAPTAAITEGTYLSSVAGTSFQIVSNGSGSYTVDAVILGATCGATGNGQLFTIDVAGVSDGAATASVTAVTVRDCDNGPVPGTAGSGAAITVDTVSPASVTSLTSSQDKLTNPDTESTTAINLAWTGSVSGDADSIDIYRRGTGEYPEYGSGPTPPAAPGVDPVGDGWTYVTTLVSGMTTYADDPGTRDFFFYVAYVRDACGLVSTSSTVGLDATRGTAGTLSYHLGDVSDGLTAGTGDNRVDIADIGLLGANYGLSGGAMASVNYLDVGPTTDGSVNALPVPDDNIGFEDLILFSINYEVVMRAPAPVVDTDAPVLVMDMDRSNGIVTAHLRLDGNRSTVKGIHTDIAFDRDRLALVSVEQGELLSSQSASVFFRPVNSRRGIVVDAAVMGHDLTVEGTGEVATLHFRVLSGDATPKLVVADLRDRDNARLDGTSLTPGDALSLAGARPNPFGASTAIAFRTAESGRVSVRIYDIGGRMIRSLVDGTLPAGDHAVTWDGRNAEGRSVAAGVYFYTFRSGDHRETHKLFRYVK